MCTYTAPEVAQIGLTAEAAKARRIAFVELKYEMNQSDRAILDLEGCDDGFVNLVLQQGSDKILGATVVSSHAGDIIATISLCMSANIGLTQIGASVFPYPSHSESLKRLADKYNFTKLTPVVKSVLDTVLQLRRNTKL